MRRIHRDQQGISMKHFYLDRNRKFIECELLRGDNYKQFIRLLEGPEAGREMMVRPEGVAKGWLYPRIFHLDKKPTGHFITGRRIMLKREDSKNPLIPAVDTSFRFQGFAQDIIDDIVAGDHTLLTGGTGVGKTTHIVQLAAQTNIPLLRINLNAETRLSDFLGKIHVIDGDTKWIDGVLPMAMRNGYWLLLDEIDFADPALLSLLHPVLEENPQLVLKENAGEVVKPHPDFRIFGTANSIGAMKDRASSYAGTSEQNAATENRWNVIHVPSLSKADELRVIMARVKGIRRHYAKSIVDFASRVRSNKVEGGLDISPEGFTTRRVLKWAAKTALHDNPLKGAMKSWIDTVALSEQEPVIRALKLHFGASGRRKARVKPEESVDAIPVKVKKVNPTK
jgi:cobaltochelatase CobS